MFIEVGAKQVLKNLMRKKWIRRPRYATDSRENTAEHLDGVLAKLDINWRLPRASLAGAAPTSRAVPTRPPERPAATISL